MIALYMYIVMFAMYKMLENKVYIYIYMLVYICVYVEHVSEVITNRGQHEWVIPSFFSVAP